MNRANNEVKVCGNMALKKATFDIGTCNYHGWPWDIGLINKPHLHIFHCIFCYLIRILNYQPPFDAML
jgi:hypothetical protein